MTTKKKFNDVMVDVHTALPPLPSEIGNHLETGSRGHAAQQLAYTLVLQRVSGLNVDQEVERARDGLRTALAAEIGREQAATYGEADIRAVEQYITARLGEAPEVSGERHTLAEIRSATKAAYPSLEDLGLQFSEQHPKPYRSSPVEPILLQRIPGLDASRPLQEALEKLEQGYIGVPKHGNQSVQAQEAAHITKIAREKTGDTIDSLLGKVKQA